jgi:hypothetical protein
MAPSATHESSLYLAEPAMTGEQRLKTGLLENPAFEKRAKAKARSINHLPFLFYGWKQGEQHRCIA